MLEHCDHCLAPAPAWESTDYLSWYLGVTEDGRYLGVICPSCFAGDELAFMGAQPPAPPSRRRAIMLASFAGSASGLVISVARSVVADCGSLIERLSRSGAQRSYSPGR